MSSSIFLWEPRTGRIGHVSLRISPHLYISLWPKSSYNSWDYLFNNTVDSKAYTYEDDCTVEGGKDASGRVVPRHPDQIEEVTFYELDIDNVALWWDFFQNGGYDFENNCCFAVREALEVALGIDNPQFERLSDIVTQWENRLKASAADTKGGKKGTSNRM